MIHLGQHFFTHKQLWIQDDIYQPTMFEAAKAPFNRVTLLTIATIKTNQHFLKQGH
jgi:hypothetical protein